MWTMRLGLAVIALLLLQGSAPGEARHIRIEAAVHSLTGQLLVATPELDDPNFRHAIVYMVHHDADGALGVVVNRVIGAGPLGDLLQALGIQEGSDSETQVQVHYGGPVQLDHVVVLHSLDYQQDNPLVVDQFAAFSDSPAVLRDLALGRGPRNSLLAFGYAGWQANQLETELARGSWFTIEPDEKLLYDNSLDAEAKWRRALALRGVDL